MARVSVITLGVREKHARDYTVDRPRGVQCHLYLNFLTPMRLVIRDETLEAEPGDVLIYAPGHPHYYTGRDVGFVDNWMHFTGEGVPALLKRYGLPVNTVVRPSATHYVAGIMEDIIRERLRCEPHWREEVGSLVERLLRRTGRALHADATASLTRIETTHLDRFRDVRARAHASLRRPWRVRDMATLAHLSPSRFATLYARLFGLSPMEDLIRARIEHAKHLLTNAVHTVSGVARLSGFACVSHFSRIFRKRVGCAPRDFSA